MCCSTAKSEDGLLQVLGQVPAERLKPAVDDKLMAYARDIKAQTTRLDQLRTDIARRDTEKKNTR